MNRPLQVVATLGVLFILGQQTVQAFPIQPRQGYSLLVLLLAAMGVALAFALFLPRQAGQLIRHPNLLVPLGLFVLLEAALGWFASLPVLQNVFMPSKTVEFAKLSFTLSVSFAVLIVAAVTYAAWVTTLILNVVSDGNDDLRAGLRGMRWFGRVFLILFIGWGVIFAALAVVLILVSGSIFLAIVLIAVFALVWNLLTAALLPAALDPRLGTLSAIGRGFRSSRTGLSKWWAAVLAQLVLLGFVTFVHVSYTRTQSEQRGGMTTVRTQHQTTTNWGGNAFWTGGYDNDCRWHAALMSAVEAPRLAPVSTLLSLLMGTLAIGVKLRIARGLKHLPTTLDAPPIAEPPGQTSLSL